MVNDLVIAAQVLVLIFEDVKAMGAGGNDFFDVIIIKRLDVLVSHHLEHKFIAGPANGVARAHFLFAQDGEVNLGSPENPGQRPQWRF